MTKITISLVENILILLAYLYILQLSDVLLLLKVVITICIGGVLNILYRKYEKESYTESDDKNTYFIPDEIDEDDIKTYDINKLGVISSYGTDDMEYAKQNKEQYNIAAEEIEDEYMEMDKNDELNDNHDNGINELLDHLQDMDVRMEHQLKQLNELDDFEKSINSDSRENNKRLAINELKKRSKQEYKKQRRESRESMGESRESMGESRESMG